MFSPFRFRTPRVQPFRDSIRAAFWPLGALLLAPLAPARAQSGGPAAPILRALPTGLPAGQTATNAPRIAPEVPVVMSGSASPQTLISPGKRVKVTAKTRFTASRVALLSSDFSGLAIPKIPAPKTARAPLPAAPAPNQLPNQSLSGVQAIAPLPDEAATIAQAPIMKSPPPLAIPGREGNRNDNRSEKGAARLASRGGLMPNRAPVEVRPAPPQIGALTDKQRRLLAQLDADLGHAQRRLDRAETRLSEGQRQLGSVTGVLQSAMLEGGVEGRGLHPFVRVAQRYMGTPYVWGGESARGFDCSGFIMRVMRDLGYSALPHSAAEQFRYGMPVSRDALKPGDIVFFANTYKPGVSHVGIYLGRNRFIHAANSQVGTIESGLNEPKWIQHYAGARRLLRVKS